MEKGLELVFRHIFHRIFWWKKLFCNITYTGQIPLPGYGYFPSYSIICVSRFMPRHLMTSWHLNVCKIKIWLSQERKELSKWNKNYFSLFYRCSLLDIQNTSKKVADTTFKSQLVLIKKCFVQNSSIGGP